MTQTKETGMTANIRVTRDGVTVDVPREVVVRGDAAVAAYAEQHLNAPTEAPSEAPGGRRGRGVADERH